MLACHRSGTRSNAMSRRKASGTTFSMVQPNDPFAPLGLV